MEEFFIDQTAESALASGQTILKHDSGIVPDDLNLIKQRILEAAFDCTPNWGIRGTGPADASSKRNWYLRDPRIRTRAEERISNIDFDALGTLVDDAAKNMINQKAEVVGFGVYGSYLYREATHPPEDLDVLVIVDSVKGVALDALRYRHARLPRVFRDRTLPRPQTNEMGLTIVSRDQFHPDNRSFVVADAALLDVSTTVSHNVQVVAPPLSPFIITLNALKIVHWGLSSLPVKPTSTMSRIDEALRMRAMVMAEYPQLGLSPVETSDYLPPSAHAITEPGEKELFDASKAIISVLKDDERKIREHTAAHLHLV